MPRAKKIKYKPGDVFLVPLRISDVEAHPVWQFANRDRAGELLVRPVEKLPTKDLIGKIVGTKIRLANQDIVWGLIGNVDVKDSRRTRHLLTLSVARDGEWIALARYHDFDYTERGPDALCRKLRLEPNDAFSICYDLRGYSEGNPEALVGKVEKSPFEKLSRSEIIAMAVL